MLLFFPLTIFGQSMEYPFAYDLNLYSVPGKNGRVMICCHGYGDNYQIACTLKDLNCIDSTLISFNFPDYDIKNGRNYDPRRASFGTMDELLPALFVIKQFVIDQGLDSIDLYGFSAGGGAVINVIGTLNTSTQDVRLKRS